MSGKIFVVAVGIVIVIALAMALPAVQQGVESFRTDLKTQEYTVTTGGGVTTANITLQSELWNLDVTEVTNLSSDNTSDAPVASAYTDAGNIVTITGLAASTTRTVTVSYRTSGLDDYQGAEAASLRLPTIVVALVIIIPLAILASIFLARR